MKWKQANRKQSKDQCNEELILEKINTIDSSLAHITKRNQLNLIIRIRYEQRNITTDTIEMENFLREHFKTLSSIMLENLFKKMNEKFIQSHS